MEHVANSWRDCHFRRIDLSEEVRTMGFGEYSMLRPLAPQTLGAEDRRSDIGLRGQSGANRAESSPAHPQHGCGTSSQERLSDISDIVCDLFKEDFSHRA